MVPKRASSVVKASSALSLDHADESAGSGKRRKTQGSDPLASSTCSVSPSSSSIASSDTAPRQQPHVLLISTDNSSPEPGKPRRTIEVELGPSTAANTAGECSYDLGAGNAHRLEWKIVPSSSAAGPPQSPPQAPASLQLKYRRVRDSATGNIKGAPVQGSAEERWLVRKLGRCAVAAFRDKTKEVESALEQNRLELERLTNDPDATPEEITTVSLERQCLKKELARRKAPDAEACFEYEGEELVFEVGMGERVHLKGLPGRPSVVWASVGGSLEGDSTVWATGYKVLVGKGPSLDVAALKYSRSIGSEGKEDGQLMGITGVALDEDCIYACDDELHQVSVYSRASGAFLRKWGREGSGAGEFNSPYGIAVDEEHVFVCDCDNNRVQVFTKEGVYVRSVGDENRKGKGALNNSDGIAVDTEHIYVTNWEGHFVSVFAKASGAFVCKWGSRGSEQGEFNRPTGIAVDNQHVYVSDYGNHRVQVFTKAGIHVRTLGGGHGSGPTQLNEPCGVALDDEHVFVCDRNNERVQVFAKADGQHVRELRVPVSGATERFDPICIAVRDGEVVIADLNNQRIVVLDDDIVPAPCENL